MFDCGTSVQLPLTIEAILQVDAPSESGAAQVEINFDHGDPLEIADQAFLFKRTMRQAALRHGIYATFMAKPYEGEPGSAMHIHQSIVSAETGDNLFATKQGKDTKLFLGYIAGLQKFLPGQS